MEKKNNGKITVLASIFIACLVQAISTLTAIYTDHANIGTVWIPALFVGGAIFSVSGIINILTKH